MRRPEALLAPPPSLRRWLVVYLGMIGAATLASVDPGRSLWGAPSNLHGALVLAAGPLFALLLLSSWRTVDARERQVTALIVGSAPVTLYGLIQALGLDPLPWAIDAVSPVLSTLGRSNFLGAYLALVSPFILARLWEAPLSGLTVGATRWRYGMLLGFTVICLLLTQARGAWIGFVAAATLCLGLLAYRWRDRRLALAALKSGSGSRLYFPFCQSACASGDAFGLTKVTHARPTVSASSTANGDQAFNPSASAPYRLRTVVAAMETSAPIVSTRRVTRARLFTGRRGAPDSNRSALVAPREGFGTETHALGVPHGMRDWTLAPLSALGEGDAVLLATDGVSDDLLADRSGAIVRWMVDDLQSAPRAGTRIAAKLRAWPVPRHLDDKTVLLAWTEDE
jgi:hypothetical protein